MYTAPLFSRANSQADVENITETVTQAFKDDPTWSPVIYPNRSFVAARSYWRLFVNAAARHGWSFTDQEASAVSVWYPPGASELAEEEEAGFREFATGLFGDEVAKSLFAIGKEFEDATPKGEFFYLSLLAVHPAHRKKGWGMKLLKENLREIDALRIPTYLESSNPANDQKYERLGYSRHGRFKLPSELIISTFWRNPQK